MSELTPCNYCTLQRIKRNAIRDGKVVTVLPGGIGRDVYVHPPDVVIPKGTDSDDYATGSPPYWIASMMEIGSSCEC